MDDEELKRRAKTLAEEMVSYRERHFSGPDSEIGNIRFESKFKPAFKKQFDEDVELLMGEFQSRDISTYTFEAYYNDMFASAGVVVRLKQELHHLAGKVDRC